MRSSNGSALTSAVKNGCAAICSERLDIVTILGIVNEEKGVGAQPNTLWYGEHSLHLIYLVTSV